MDISIYERLFDGVNSAIMLVDSDFNVKFTNSNFALISGLHPDGMGNKKCYQVLHGYNAPCKNCPLVMNSSKKVENVIKKVKGTVTFTQDIITHKGARLFMKTSFFQIDRNLFAETLVDITAIEQERRDVLHDNKSIKAQNFRLQDKKNSDEAISLFLQKSIDNMANGMMVIDKDYNIKVINKVLLSSFGVGQYENKKCYMIYGLDSVCKDCPFLTNSEKSMRQVHSKHMTVLFSKFDTYVIETLRDTTREIKLIDEIRESQEEIKEKQRQMSILNADLLRMNEQLKKAQSVIEQEFQQVGYIQESLLPAKLPDFPGYQFAATYIPAEQAGGDYYDTILMSNNYCGLVVADVSGHGSPAAVIMAITRAIMRSSTYDIISASEALTLVNDILCDNIHTKDFVTMFYAVLNPANGTFNLASAGHNPVLFFDSSEFIVKKITANGMFLGTFQGLTYEEKHWNMDDGDIFFMYTDGLVEAMNPERQQYGYDRLISKIMMFSTYHPEQIVSEIMSDVREFAEGHPFEDDVTILIVKKEKSAASEEGKNKK